MGYESTLPKRRAAWSNGAAEAPTGRCVTRNECLGELLQAFYDLVDRDDIHEAARRLALVQQWIRDEARRAAADPIFADLLPA
jgi:hypothetical protein